MKGDDDSGVDGAAVGAYTSICVYAYVYAYVGVNVDALRQNHTERRSHIICNILYSVIHWKETEQTPEGDTGTATE